jgi:N-formylglutamate deformylase
MRLPVLITVPHGGTDLPPEASACLLTPHQIALDGDTWARRLYDLQDEVLGFKDTTVPRAVIDLNRAPNDLPPANPDGVVKAVAVDGTRVWPEPAGPRPELTRTLLERYHTPWHEAVAAVSSVPGLALGLDCHTMLAIGRRGHPLAGKPRPLVCLSNGGDARGLKSDRSLTASTELALSFLENLALTFRNEDVEIDMAEPPVRLNDPFRGGYVSRRHSSQGPLPWLQLELSRALYLPKEFGLEPGAADLRRLADLREKILKALQKTL